MFVASLVSETGTGRVKREIRQTMHHTGKLYLRMIGVKTEEKKYIGNFVDY